MRQGTTLLALLLALATASARAQNAQSAAGPRGFRAITGPAAATFRVPSEMRLVAREQGGAPGTSASVVAERYRQYFGDVEVLGGQLTVHRDAAGRRDAVIGAHYPGLVPANRIRVSSDAAQSIAAARRPNLGASWIVGLIIDPSTSRYLYRAQSRAFNVRWFYWIDAESGEVVNEYDGLTTGLGLGVHQDWKDLSGLTTRNKGVYRMASSGNRLKTNDAGGAAIPGSLATDANDVWDTIGRASPGQGALVDAHFYANVVDRYYRIERGFDWRAHYPEGIVSSAHVNSNYSNAFWNGAQVGYGDGDGVNFLEFSGDLDVVAHELSHGVTEATSGLIYQNESGALSEAFSDIMATVIEAQYEHAQNWTIGEDITPLANGFRNLANPGEYGHPSHYADRLLGVDDNGFVHYNSGIANQWFYLLTAGGQNANRARSITNVRGIGLDAAADIAYLGFTALTASATFCSARTATMAAAGEHLASVAAAWDEVGVTSALCTPVGGNDTTPPEILLVVAQQLSSTSYRISWSTNEPSNSEVTFSNGNTFTDLAFVSMHTMDFTGKKNATYVYTVASRDAAGNRSSRGPFSIRLR
jgi:Zn-dependent metalloprotease